MATKKQKRLEGERRQAKNREESRLSGLAAQKRDHEIRERAAQDRAKRAAKEAKKLEKQQAIAQIKEGIDKVLNTDLVEEALKQKS